MWVKFAYDKEYQCQGWRKAHSPEEPGVTEVPDHIVRRWDLIYELFCEVQIEAGEWKHRGMHRETRALPEKRPMELVEKSLIFETG